MHQILVVDDDPVIRGGIIQIIGRHFEDAVRVFQAGSGLEALEIVCAEAIDIIVADIKMPVCGGIEMLERMHGLGLNPAVIIVSGFDEYEYVRKAMKLGAKDYILKPVVEEELVCLLRNCMQNIARGRSAEALSGPHTASLLHEEYEQQYYLRQLLSPGPQEDISGLGHKKILVAAVDCLRGGQGAFGGEKSVLFIQYRQLATECIQVANLEGVRVVLGQAGGYWCLCFISDADIPLVEILEKQLKKMDVRHGVAGRCYAATQGAAAWQEAVVKLEYHFYDISPVMEPDKEFPFDDVQKELLAAIRGHDILNCERLLYRIFGLCCYRNVPPDKARQFFVEHIYNLMMQENSFIRVMASYKFTSMDIVQIIQESTSASVMRDGMVSALATYIAAVEEKKKEQVGAAGDEDYTVQKVKYYIEKNYHTDISLGEISNNLGLHPNYLSTLFRKKKGITYSQYLRKVRIDKAKELLEDTNLKLYDIAARVGYKDNAHFYRAFKEETGVSPAHYKKNIQKTFQ